MSTAWRGTLDPVPTLEMTLRCELDGLNKLLRPYGKLPAARARAIATKKAKRFLTGRVLEATQGFKLQMEPGGARVSIKSYRWALLDHDNLVGGGKHLLDVLVARGFLRDDSPRWIGRPEYEQEIDRAERRTVVRIEYLESEVA